MKVVDIINKIANDENMPRKIMYEGEVFEYRRDLDDYECYDEINDHYDYLLENPFGKAYSEFYNDEIGIVKEKAEKKLYELCKTMYEEDKEIEKGLKPFGEYWEEINIVGCDLKEAQEVYLDRLSKIVIELVIAVNELKKGK